MKRILQLALVLLALTVPGWSQANQNNFPGKGTCITTVGGLANACGAASGTLATVTDGTTTGDCTVGGGSVKNACIYNGSTWSWASNYTFPTATTATESTSTVTLTTTSGNFPAAFQPGQNVSVTGCSVAGYNITAPILTGGAGGTTLTYTDSTGSLGAATGCTASISAAFAINLGTGAQLTGTPNGALSLAPGCINALALLSGAQTMTNVDWGLIIRTYWNTAGSGSCVDMRALVGTTHSWITSPWGNVAAGNALPASFQGSIILPCNAIGVVSSTFITPFQGQFINGCTGAQLNSYGYTFQLCNSNVGQTCPNSAPNFPTGDGAPALDAVSYGIPNGNPASPGLIAPKTCNSLGTGTMTNGATYCPNGSALSTSGGTTVTCVGCAWPTGQNSVLAKGVLVVTAGTGGQCSAVIEKILTSTTAQLTSQYNANTGCGADLASNTTWTIYVPNIAPFWWDGGLGQSWFQDCVGSKLKDFKVDMNGVAGAVGYFTVNCQERTEGLDFGVVHQTCVGTNGCSPSGWTIVANTSTKGQLPFAVPVACILMDGSLAPGGNGWAPANTLWNGGQCGIGAGAGGANTFGMIYEGTNIVEAYPSTKNNDGPQIVQPGTIVGKSGHLMQTAVAINGVEGGWICCMHAEWISDDVVSVGSDNNPTGDVYINGGIMVANTIASTAGTAAFHFYPSASGNCIGNTANFNNGYTWFRDDHYGYVPPNGTGGPNTVQGEGQLMSPPYCQPGTFGWGSSTYFANSPALVSAANVGVIPSLNTAKVWGFTVPAGQTVTFSKVTYYVGTADNSATTYDLGMYQCTSAAGCATGGTGTLIWHTGSLAGTTFAPTSTTLTSQPVIQAISGGSIVTLVPGSYYLALTTSNSTQTSPLILAGNATNDAGVNWLTSGTNGNVTVTAGGTLPATVTLPSTLMSIATGNNNTPFIALNGAVVP